MRFMTSVYAKENQGAPPKALIEAIGRLGRRLGQAGVFVNGRLLPAAAAAGFVKPEAS